MVMCDRIVGRLGVEVENEMGGACGTYGKEKTHTRGFGTET
jgi:hypothetical protein